MEFEERSLSVEVVVTAWKGGSLQRNDEYQRGEAWSTAQKQGLIDSIMRGYPIPVLYVHEISATDLMGENQKKHEVVDGQQRIIALTQYLDDKFPLLKPTDKSLRLPSSMRQTNVSWAGKTFSSLNDEDKSKVRDRLLKLYVLRQTDHDDQVRDLFIRLQSGSPLTPQQVRDAWPGTIGPLVESLAGKMDRQPSLQLFDIVDGRGAKDTDSDEKDQRVKHRITCAQVIHILIARMSNPGHVPSVASSDLNHLYHEQTNLQSDGTSVNQIKSVLQHCDQVAELVPNSTNGSKRRIAKIRLFCLAMFVQDMTKNPDVVMSTESRKKLATFLYDDSEPTPPRSYQGPTIGEYYDRWRDRLPDGIGFVRDKNRCFTGDQKQELLTRADGKCSICNKLINISEAEGDHYPILWRDGGKTDVSNGRIVCKSCHPRGKMMYQQPS